MVATVDKVFAGSIPEFYERFMVPLIFEPYALDLAGRLAKTKPATVLETAAGTGVVTRALAAALPPETRLTITDLNQPMLDHAAAAVQLYGVTDFQAKNAIALERLKTEFKGKVEVLQFPVPVLRDLKRLATEVMRTESEKTPMARKVHASFTKFQALLAPWDHVTEGAYHKSVGG